MMVITTKSPMDKRGYFFKMYYPFEDKVIISRSSWGGGRGGVFYGSAEV
jgi:hypothetical protein